MPGVTRAASKPLPLASPRAPALRSLALRAYRFAVLAFIVLVVREHHTRLRIDGDRPIHLGEVAPLLPEAAALRPDPSPRAGLFALDSLGRRIGYVVRTSPASDRVVGYAGPTDTLIVLGPDDRVLGIAIRHSWDTPNHVQDIRNDAYFMNSFKGKSWDEMARLRAEHVEGVSGATLTSSGMAEAIGHRFRTQALHAVPSSWLDPHFRLRDLGLLAVLAFACLVAFTRLRARRAARITLQALALGYVGLLNGDLIAQSLLAGWAGAGLPWRHAPGLVLLTAAALLIPWGTRRQLYCSQLCPHGVAQQWVHRVSPWRLRLRPDVARGLAWLPPGLLVLVLIVVMLRLPLDLAGIEPFDAYLFPAAGWATLAVAAISLLAAAFVPQAYCRFGCPTGALLEFVRSHGKADRFGARDALGGALAALALGLHLAYDPLRAWLL
jgi:hypothetical protein